MVDCEKVSTWSTWTYDGFNISNDILRPKEWLVTVRTYRVVRTELPPVTIAVQSTDGPMLAPKVALVCVRSVRNIFFTPVGHKCYRLTSCFLRGGAEDWGIPNDVWLSTFSVQIDNCSVLWRHSTQMLAFLCLDMLQNASDISIIIYNHALTRLIDFAQLCQTTENRANLVSLLTSAI